MVDMRKEQERAELHRSIWNIANDLRGSVDGWDFKQYVLGIMFYRYISENLTNYINKVQHDSGDMAFDYAKMSDDEAMSAKSYLISTKGFFIKPSELFSNIVAEADSDDNLNVTLDKIFKNIESSAIGTASEPDFKGLFDDIDVNSNKLGGTVAERNKRLVKLLTGIAEMKLGNYQDNTIDAFGDAYEYLMGMYASNAGKSGGEYYTPQEVSELLTKITLVGKTEVNKVYDPACGSGSLLLKFAKILGKENVRNGFYGQEINISTYNLCRINMFLHDIEFDKFDIAHGDTLINPSNDHWNEEPFEAIVSNPPYSIKWEGDDNPLLINDTRFSPAGVLAPKSKADLAFIMHSLSWLASNGTAAIVCFPGIMYRGGAEQKIRKYLIDNNFVDCVIQLPDNLFYGTSIATCIMVLKKNKTDNSTLFIDASKQCVKVTNNNKLSEDNINSIIKYFTDRVDVDYISKLVPNSKIAEEDYNLSVSTYVEQEDTREVIDIVELNKKISDIVARENVLRAEIDKIISEIEVG
jgi:type I restriction enzyme M protein